MEMPKVLLIDRCRITALLLKHLAARIGVRADTADSYEAGLQLAQTQDYPLCFIDASILARSGSEALRPLRARPDGGSRRLIVLSSLGEEAHATDLTAAGADGVFFKPIVPSRVIGEIERAVPAELEPHGAL
ncbi:MAG TPA: response regulator [Planctomycetota bacterium]|nr:response regulator [Planctomycetota bacterium]